MKIAKKDFDEVRKAVNRALHVLEETNEDALPETLNLRMEEICSSLYSLDNAMGSFNLDEYNADQDDDEDEDIDEDEDSEE